LNSNNDPVTGCLLNNKYPNKLKTKWNNGLEDEVLNEIYDPSGLCEECDSKDKGAYFVDGVVGLCYEHILEQYGEENVEIIQ